MLAQAQRMTGTGLAAALGLAGCGGGAAENTSPTTAIAAKLTGINVVLPMMVIGLAVRRYLVCGLTLGAVTGE